jgi:hypothetical protein
MGDRRLPGVDAMGVGDHPTLLGLAEHLGEPDPGQPLGGQQIPQHLPGADAGELVDVADQQQLRPGGMALMSLLATSTSSMEASSTTRSASRGRSRSKAASPPGRSCSSRCRVAASSPASSDRRLAARPVGAANRILARLARARATTARTV